MVRCTLDYSKYRWTEPIFLYPFLSHGSSRPWDSLLSTDGLKLWKLQLKKKPALGFLYCCVLYIPMMIYKNKRTNWKFKPLYQKRHDMKGPRTNKYTRCPLYVYRKSTIIDAIRCPWFQYSSLNLKFIFSVASFM